MTIFHINKKLSSSSTVLLNKGSFEECLSSLEYHAVIYFEELIHEQPSAVGTKFSAVSVPQYPMPVLR